MDYVILILSIILILLPLGLSAKGDDYFKDGVAIQKTAKTPAPDAKSISAKVDGKWQSFPLVDFPQNFWDWNKNGRKEYLDIFREMLAKGPEATRQPGLAGPHNGIIATYGAKRFDSAFKLNNAIKGMGFLPKAERLPGLISKLSSTLDEPLGVKLEILDSLYSSAEEVFAPDRLISLELYSEPGYLTQTFINQMTNPASVIVWMDIPTFKVKTIARLLDPKDSKLTSYERQCVEYVNLMHSYFHGEFPRDYIASVYFVTEVYDSSPGRLDARGTKLK